ncbi:family 16 glycoside hydrolase [Chloroflexota bacterium]
MTANDTRESRAWLVGTGLALFGIVVVVILTGGLGVTQAQESQLDVGAVGADEADELSTAQAELSVRKEVSPARVLFGEPVTFTVVFLNSGDVTGTLELVSDTLDPRLKFVGMVDSSDVMTTPLIVSGKLVWDSLDVPPGEELILRYTVTNTVESGWAYPCNLVEASTGSVKLEPATSCITVGPVRWRLNLAVVTREWSPAVLFLEKSASPSSVQMESGDKIVYTVNIRNEGDSDATMLLHDTLPPGFTYLEMVAGSALMADPVGTTGEISWADKITVPARGQVQMKYRVAPSDVPKAYVNTARAETYDAYVPEGPASTTVRVSPPILLEEDFNSGMSRWTPYLHYYRLKDGQWFWDPTDGVGGSGGLDHHCCNIGDSEAEDALIMYLEDDAESWTDYRLEVKLNLRTLSHPQGVWVRGQHEDSDLRQQWVTGYYVMVGGTAARDNRYVRLLQLQTETDCWGGACENYGNLYSFNNPHELHTARLDDELSRWVWHTLVVEVRGDEISAWLDGEHAFTYRDEKEPFLTGTVGLKAYNADFVTYDDVVVTPLD